MELDGKTSKADGEEPLKAGVAGSPATGDTDGTPGADSMEQRDRGASTDMAAGGDSQWLLY